MKIVNGSLTALEIKNRLLSFIEKSRSKNRLVHERHITIVTVCCSLVESTGVRTKGNIGSVVRRLPAVIGRLTGMLAVTKER